MRKWARLVVKPAQAYGFSKATCAPTAYVT